ncbi:MAG: LysM domain-containing protein [Bacteroidales bacterium]|nr:LysM domain-containing protein [Bacteroidales bacterium]
MRLTYKAGIIQYAVPPSLPIWGDLEGLSVDPLQFKYPHYTPYQYAGNKPISYIDLDGGEEALMHWLIPPVNPKTPAGYISRDVAQKTKNFSESRTGKVLKGAQNTVFGVVGVFISGVYILGTDGAGAALGGVIAMQFSLGETVIGVTQIIEAVSSNSGKNEFLQKSGSIPGLIAYGMNSKYAPFIDALGQMVPYASMINSIKDLRLLGMVNAVKEYTRTPNAITTLNMIDTWQNTKGIVIESIKLFTQYDKNDKLVSQKVETTFNYTVKKGDTLTDIAKTFKTDIDTIVKANNIKDPDSIQIGQKLKMEYNN